MNKPARGRFKPVDRRKRRRTRRAHEFFLRAGRAASVGAADASRTRRACVASQTRSHPPQSQEERGTHFELKECHPRRLPRGRRKNTKTFIYITTTGVTKARCKSNHIKTRETAPRIFETAAAGRRLARGGSAVGA